jgi:hypothetical protein
MIKVNGIEVTKGCTVKFRCGGEAVINDWADNKGNSDTSRIFLDGYDDEEYLIYYNTGKYFEDENNPFDIIEVIPPEFDWNTVKQGMAFIDKAGDIFYYHITMWGAVDWVICAEEKDGSGSVDCLKKHLTRAPEHDIEVNND